ncbi:MAG: EVE domain-containing protein [Neisseriaceae bacterium]|nr:MAG: EVE domain-containing protein [Neisseriaceae bacterium]
MYGICTVATNAHPDSLQFDINSDYYEPKSTSGKSLKWCVDIKFEKKTRYVSIKELREYSELSSMKVLQKGNRLSITPITEDE